VNFPFKAVVELYWDPPYFPPDDVTDEQWRRSAHLTTVRFADLILVTPDEISVRALFGNPAADADDDYPRVVYCERQHYLHAGLERVVVAALRHRQTEMPMRVLGVSPRVTAS
jgi:hypothetical protein